MEEKSEGPPSSSTSSVSPRRPLMQEKNISLSKGKGNEVTFKEDEQVFNISCSNPLGRGGGGVLARETSPRTRSKVLNHQTSNNSSNLSTTLNSGSNSFLGSSNKVGGRKRNLSATESSGSSTKRRTVPPPDGGYGWVVVLAAFVINMIADGVSLSIGIIYIELDEYFNESKSKTAWVGSIFLSIPLIAGPIASTLVDRFGCRRVAITGSLLSSLGFLLGHFATSLEHLFVAFSISGLGLALCFVTTVVSVAFYFEKRRSLATGLSVCGTGVGTIIFAPLTITLMEEYGWRGTLLILSGVFLNIMIFGALMRDLEEDEESDDDESSETSSVIGSDLMSDYKPYEVHSTNGINGTFQCGIGSTHPQSAAGKLSSKSDEKNSPGEEEVRLGGLGLASRPFSSLVDIPTYISNEAAQTRGTVISELSCKKGSYLNKLIQHYPKIFNSLVGNPAPSVAPVGNLHQVSPGSRAVQDISIPRVGSQLTAHLTDSKPLNCTSSDIISAGNNNEEDKTTSLSVIIPMDKQIQSWTHPSDQSPVLQPVMESAAGESPRGRTKSFTRTGSRRTRYSNPFACHPSNEVFSSPNAYYLRNLKLQRGSVTYRSAMLNISHRYKLRASSAPDIFRNSMSMTDEEEKNENFLTDMRQVLRDMVDFSIFKSFRYSLFCLSNFLLYACIDVPYVYLPDEAQHSGAADKESSSYLISILGILNTLGVMIVGYIGDKSWLDSTLLYSAFVAISGISMAVIPWIKNFFGLATVSGLYGFTISANYTLISVILVNMVGVDLLTKHYGPLLLVQGLATLVGPPIAGWLYDMSGDYSSTFYATGIIIFISGAMVLPIAKTFCSVDDSSSRSSFFALSRPSSPEVPNKTHTGPATGNGTAGTVPFPILNGHSVA